MTPQQLDTNAITNMNNFVESIRREEHPNNTAQGVLDLEQAQQRAQRSIVEVEKFKAVIEQPGNHNNHCYLRANVDAREQSNLVELGKDLDPSNCAMQLQMIQAGSGVFGHLLNSNCGRTHEAQSRQNNVQVESTGDVLNLLNIGERV